MDINIKTDLLKIVFSVVVVFTIYYVGYSIGNLQNDAMCPKIECPITEPVVKYLPLSERANDCNRLGGNYLFYLDQDMDGEARETCRIDKVIDSF